MVIFEAQPPKIGEMVLRLIRCGLPVTMHAQEVLYLNGRPTDFNPFQVSVRDGQPWEAQEGPWTTLLEQPEHSLVPLVEVTRVGILLPSPRNGEGDWVRYGSQIWWRKGAGHP